MDLSTAKDLQFDQNETDTFTSTHSQDNEIIHAKLAELEEWKTCNVYTEVENQGQNSISLRWVMKTKVTDDKTHMKARLCARGFEEEQEFRTDSPTCSR